MTRNWGFVCDGSNGTHLWLMFMDEMSLGVLDKLTQKISWWGTPPPSSLRQTLCGAATPACLRLLWLPSSVPAAIGFSVRPA